IRQVRDPSLRRHYGDEVNRLRQDLFGGQRAAARTGGGGFRPRGRFGGEQPAQPMVETKASALAAAGAPFEEQLREAVILATLVQRPALVTDFVADLERLETSQPEHEAVRTALIAAEDAGKDELERLCGAHALEKIFAPRHVRISPGLRPDVPDDTAQMVVAEEFAKLTARRGARREIEDALRDVEGLVDEGLTWRLGQAAEAVNQSSLGAREDRTEYDLGPNGARMKRDEKSAFDALVSKINYTKRGGRGA
ncbi:MAG: DNA primase, partial [Silicimonas sp.]|nr:DNA primase [Silicimonas sp.]